MQPLRASRCSILGSVTATQTCGIEGLHIVDACAMPTAVSANTDISTIANAERVADLTRETR
jgi:choline dehydrogenase-like flavoprotein